MLKPLLCIMSPRNIPHCIKAHDDIDYVDKYWIKYHTEREALMEANSFFRNHKEYTHLIITSDDAAPNYDTIAKLMVDFSAHPEIEVISGVIGMNHLNGDNRLSVTIEPITFTDADSDIEFIYEDKFEVPKSGHLRAWKKLLPYDFVSTQGLIRVWFQGFALTMITRRVFDQIGGLRTLYENTSEMMSDVQFAYDCLKNNVAQYVDLRAFFPHYKHKEFIESYPEYEVLNSGRKGTTKSTKLVLATAPVPVEEPAKILSEEDLKAPMMVYNFWYNQPTRS